MVFKSNIIFLRAIFSCIFACHATVNALSAPRPNPLLQQRRQPRPIQQAPDSRAIEFGIRIDKLVKRLYKLKDADSDDLMDILLCVKIEVEEFSGTKINVEKIFKDMESQLKNKIKLTPDFYAIKNKILHRKGLRAKADEKKKLPPRLEWGITVTLVGGFLYCIPLTRSIGQPIAAYGVTQIYESMVAWEEQKKKPM